MNKRIAELRGECWHELSIADPAIPDVFMPICKHCGITVIDATNKDYENSIADAWELVSEMPDFQLTKSSLSGRWYAEIAEELNRLQHPIWLGLKSAETAPTAVCKAYIAWKGGQNE